MLDELRVTVIPVGHGDSALISWMPAKQSPFYVLIDGGTKSGGEAVRKYLKDKGIKRLDRLVLSHFDSDHVNGLINLVDDLDITEYMGPCLPAFERHRWLFGDDIQRGLDTTRILEEKLRLKGVPIRYPLEEYTIRSEDRLFEMRVLSPPRQLLERLLLGNDTIQLFTQYPMPQGWLLDFEIPEPFAPQRT
jgi:glyoxylase-like metal-dependent hydrolase (beta-lactamase superfamily II)